MITLLCPTRGRPGRMRHLMASATRLAAHRPRAVFYVDEDDFASLRTADMLATTYGGRVSAVIEPRHSRPMSDLWNACAEKATDLVMFTDDEAVFRTLNWDEKVATEFGRWPDRAVLVQPDDTIHGDLCAGYFFVHLPTWRAIFGRLTPPMFSYGYADIWPMEVAAAVGRKVYLPEVVVENLAPKLQPPDRVHLENHERAVRDSPGALYNATQPDREAEVAKFRRYIEENQP